MNDRRHLSEAQINAYLDDELSDADRAQVLDALEQDQLLAQQVHALQQDMEQLRLAYAKAPGCRPPGQQHYSRQRHFIPMLAAGLLLVLGTLIGLVLAWQPPVAITPAFTAINELQPASADNERILIHVSRFDDDRIRLALDKAEAILDQSRQDQKKITVSVVANESGLAMLRESSPYADRIHRLSIKHDNVRFLACGIAMEMAQLKEGHEIHLLPDAEKIPAALSEILERIKEGWLYVKS